MADERKYRVGLVYLDAPPGLLTKAEADALIEADLERAHDYTHGQLKPKSTAAPKNTGKLPFKPMSKKT